jgi:hypothetical protein
VEAVFGEDHAPSKSMIPQSGSRFPGKIMLSQRAQASSMRREGYRFDNATERSGEIVPVGAGQGEENACSG